jgi:hypothetical protein
MSIDAVVSRIDQILAMQHQLIDPTIIPGAPHGIEIGFGSGVGQSSYAHQYGGGYSEGVATAAGVAFSNMVASLGGPAGVNESGRISGHFP